MTVGSYVKQNSDGGTDGVKLGQSATDLVGFFGATPVAQPTSASEAAVSVSVPVSICGAFGFSTSAQGVALITLVNQIRADLVILGLIKGS